MKMTALNTSICPKISKMLLVASVILCILASAKAQLPVKIVNGQIAKDDGTWGAFQPKKHAVLIDSLDKNLKRNPKDTTSLFYRAAIHLFSNDVLAKPYQREKGALENLVSAANMVEYAVVLKMQDFRLQILRAQIYKGLTYRYTADAAWMFNETQIAQRRKQFTLYKDLANKYYQELMISDPDHSYEYNQLKVATEYGL